MSYLTLSCIITCILTAQDSRLTGAEKDTMPRQEYRPQLVWKTGPVFQTPESVFYDVSRDVLFVSNFRKTDPNTESEEH